MMPSAATITPFVSLVNSFLANIFSNKLAGKVSTCLFAKIKTCESFSEPFHIRCFHCFIVVFKLFNYEFVSFAFAELYTLSIKIRLPKLIFL